MTYTHNTTHKSVSLSFLRMIVNKKLELFLSLIMKRVLQDRIPTNVTIDVLHFVIQK